MQDIDPLINNGHIHFGENKVQEAVEKWSNVKNDIKSIKLHMVGKLQTNKVKYVIPLFDYIHSLDNLKLAEKISKEQIKKNKIINLFIQINIGNEKQKNGILIEELDSFYKTCTQDLGLKIIGLMCLPPVDLNPEKYFKELYELKNLCEVSHLSMGMSADYLTATKYKSSFLRIGSSIFGSRN